MKPGIDYQAWAWFWFVTAVLSTGLLVWSLWK